MLYKKINLMLPTYKRHNTKLPEFINSAQEKAASLDNICFTFCVNEKDKETVEAIKGLCKAEYHICIEKTTEVNLAKYFNQMYEEVNLGEDVVVTMLGDDMVFITEGYDEKILEEINNYGGIGIFYADDCIRFRGDLCTNLFVTRKFVDAQLPEKFMAEEFPIDMIDIIWQEVGEKLNRCFYLNHIKILHKHATKGYSDDVWRRMRKSYGIAKENLDLHKEKLVKKRVQNIKKNLNLKSDIDFIMTTCDRIDLLQKTIMSYCGSQVLPEKLHIFDDCSKEFNEVLRFSKMVPGSSLERGKEKKECYGKTPEVLRRMFESGSMAVFIIDSDTIFYKYWYLKLITLYEELKNDEDFGCLSLFNQSSIKAEKSSRFPGLYENRSVGAFGTLITKEFWEKYIIPFEGERKAGWDNLMCSKAIKDGKKIYCTSPSFLQHIGYFKGTHTDKTYTHPTIADDFIGEIKEDFSYAVNNKVGNKKILFCLCSRKGDIIQGSMIANMLVEKGYNVTWVTIRSNSDLVNYVSPNTPVKIIGCRNDITTSWAFMDTYEMQRNFPGYKYYINAQFGSPENHYTYTNSGKHPLVWLKERCENILNEKLPDNFKDFLKLKYEKNVFIDFYEGDRPLAIIAPEAITSKAITDEIIEQYMEDLSEKYHPMILVPEVPNDLSFRQIRGKYIYRKSFIDCIYIIKNSSLFIGNDSGLAWASLYSECKKKIYHNKERINKVNTYFSYLDKNAEDVIV